MYCVNVSLHNKFSTNIQSSQGTVDNKQGNLNERQHSDTRSNYAETIIEQAKDSLPWCKMALDTKYYTQGVRSSIHIKENVEYVLGCCQQIMSMESKVAKVQYLVAGDFSII